MYKVLTNGQSQQNLRTVLQYWVYCGENTKICGGRWKVTKSVVEGNIVNQGTSNKISTMLIYCPLDSTNLCLEVWFLKKICHFILLNWTNKFEGHLSYVFPVCSEMSLTLFCLLWMKRMRALGKELPLVTAPREGLSRHKIPHSPLSLCGWTRFQSAGQALITNSSSGQTIAIPSLTHNLPLFTNQSYSSRLPRGADRELLFNEQLLSPFASLNLSALPPSSGEGP